jgi:hypothetical protein
MEAAGNNFPLLFIARKQSPAMIACLFGALTGKTLLAE